MARPALSEEAIQKVKVAADDAGSEPSWPQPPALSGALAELASARFELKAMKRSWSYRFGRTVTAPARSLKKMIRSKP